MGLIRWFFKGKVLQTLDHDFGYGPKILSVHVKDFHQICNFVYQRRGGPYDAAALFFLNVYGVECEKNAARPGVSKGDVMESLMGLEYSPFYLGKFESTEMAAIFVSQRDKLKSRVQNVLS